jgi:AcrR family transcriptional regulator
MTDQVVAENTRTAILTAARRLFLSQGYHKTAMRDIAKAAGISTGPLYFHFKSKGEIFFHICQQAAEGLLAGFRKAAAGDGRAGLRLRNMFFAYWDFFHSEPELFEILHLAENPMSGIDLPAELRKSLEALVLRQPAIMEEVIRQGIEAGEIRPLDPPTLALFLCAVADGVFQAHRSGLLQGSSSLDKMIDTAVNVLGLGMVLMPTAGDTV